MKNALKTVFNLSALGIGVPGTVLGAASTYHELTTPLTEKLAMAGVDFTIPSLVMLAVSAGLSYAGYRGVQNAAVEKYKAQNSTNPAP